MDFDKFFTFVAHLGQSKDFSDDPGMIYDRPVFRVPLPLIPRVDPLAVSTLASFVEYIAANPDDLQLMATGPPGHWIHVEWPSRVVLVGPPDGNRCRETPLIATCPVQSLGHFEFFQNPDTFIPAVMAMAAAGDRDELLGMVSSVTKKANEVLEDDGGGQTVKVDKGPFMKGWASQKNPLSLAPFRTFPEIGQPTGPFIVRWNKDGDLKLIQSPDEKWRLEAVKGIKEFLVENLPADLSIPILA